MPDAIITSTASTFGTITGTFAADQSTITGTVTGIITGTLDGSVGVPGVGVPDGGTTGQVLQKATNTSYDTVWATPSGGAWGTITGTLSNQTDLQTALNLKADLASPALTGVPTAPTAATLTSTTQLATTAFVQQELLSGTANAKNLEVYVRNQTGATLTAGSIVYINGATGNRPTITLAQANNDANSAQTFGFVKTSIANNGFGFVIVRGELENVDTSALTEGVQLYLSPTTAGTWTTTKPSAPQHLVYVGIVVRAHPTQGVILVAIQNGFEVEELHNVKITSLSNGQVLKYDSAQSLWVNASDVGIPVGGTAGQFLTKIDGTDYNTDWTTVNLSVYAVKSNNLSDLTSASTARTNLGLGTMATATAADYSTTTVANGLYYPLSTNPAGYLTSASLTGYATESWVTAGFYPLTGNPSGFITSSALTPYLTSATAASTYQTLSGMSSYLTTSAAASTYAPIASPTFTGLATFDNIGNYAISVPGSGGAGYDIRIEGQVISLRNAGTELIRIGTGGIKYPDGVTQSVAYPGSTGFLLKADNLSGLANTGTARTNLGLGTMAVETASNYLTTATAASTYQTLSGMSSYLTTATAASTYQTISGMSSYLTTASAASTYYPLVGNPSGFLTSAPVTSVAGKTGVVTLVVGDVSGAAPLASPGLTGTPTAPTAAAATNTTQIATTAFVTTADNLKANLASPTFTGTPAAPTATAGTNTTQIATTAFVTTANNLKANLASPAFTGTPSLPTGTTAVTQTAGNNTTAVATTAFVTAAVPAAATVAEAKIGSDTTKFISSNVLQKVVNSPSYYKFPRGIMSTSTSGTGAVVTAGAMITWLQGTTTGTGGAIHRYYGPSGIDIVSFTGWAVGTTYGINYAKQFRVTGSTLLALATNSIARVTFGKNANQGVGDPNQRSVGWRYNQATGFIEIIAHNGTSLVTLTTASNPSGWFEWELYNNGSGSVQMFVNDVSIGTLTGGPTTFDFGSGPTYVEEVECTATPSAQPGIRCRNGGVFLQP